MPWIASSGNQYKLVVLDTNIISEMAKKINKAHIGFFEMFPPKIYAPCFTVYSVIELNVASRAYQSFIDFFGLYPCFLLKPYLDIIRSEIACYGTEEKPSIMFNAFSPTGRDETYDLRLFMKNFWEDDNLAREITKNKRECQYAVANWEIQRNSLNYPSTTTYKRNEKNAILSFLYSINPQWIETHSYIDHEYFPGSRLMLFSQFRKIYFSNKPLGTNDVIDVMISPAMPYVDAVITETNQAETLKQAKNLIPQIVNLEITRLSDIRRI